MEANLGLLTVRGGASLIAVGQEGDDNMSDGDWVALPMGKARREDSGIVYVLIELDMHSPGDDWTKTAMKVVDQIKAELVPDGPAPMLIDAPGLEWINRESRKVFIRSDHASARAFVARSATAKATAGALATVDQSPVPTRVFSNESEARDWLQQFL